jgi:predicted DNA-binding transcriptional regulator AlpA
MARKVSMERITASRAAMICGVDRRTFYGWLKRGIVPGAAKLGDCWRIDEKKLRQWIDDRESMACQTISIGVVKLGGHASKFTGRTFDAAYERLFSRKQKSA